MKELECTHYHLPVFYMRKCMLAGFNSTIIFYRIYFQAAGYYFTGKYKILLENSAETCHCPVIAHAGIILEKFEAWVEVLLHLFQIA